MKRILTLLLAGAALLTATTASAQSAPPPQTPEEVDALYNEAMQFIGQQKFEEAIPIFEKVIEAGSKMSDQERIIVTAQRVLPACYFRTGLNLYQKQDYSAALENFEKASEVGKQYSINPTIIQKIDLSTVKTYIQMGLDAFYAKDYAGAAEFFGYSYQLDPLNQSLGLNLVECYMKLDDLEKTMTICAQLLINLIYDSLNDKPRYNDITAAQYRSTIFDLACGAARLADAQDVEDAYAAIDREISAPRRAIVDLRRGIIVPDPDPTLLMLRLLVAAEANDYARVIEWGPEAAEAQGDPQSRSEAYFRLGTAYWKTGNKAKAIENYRKVTDGPNVEQARQWLAILDV